MKKLLIIMSFVLLTISAQAGKPWDNGKLRVSDNQRYLQFENGQPFFWQGETGWLLPERLDRAEAEWYLQSCAKAGYKSLPSFYRQINNPESINMRTLVRIAEVIGCEVKDFFHDEASPQSPVIKCPDCGKEITIKVEPV